MLHTPDTVAALHKRSQRKRPHNIIFQRSQSTITQPALHSQFLSMNREFHTIKAKMIPTNINALIFSTEFLSGKCLNPYLTVRYKLNRTRNFSSDLMLCVWFWFSGSFLWVILLNSFRFFCRFCLSFSFLFVLKIITSKDSLNIFFRNIQKGWRGDGFIVT